MPLLRIRGGRSDAPGDIEGFVVRTIQRHGAELLQHARRHSTCGEDAQDAYQRALLLFHQRAARLDEDTVLHWLMVVVRREAWAVREQRLRHVVVDERQLDLLENRTSSSPEDRALEFDHVTRSAEALRCLKPQEVQALWLKATGRTYADIASELGWSFTKVNRCISEGRRSFLRHYASLETGEACARWEPVLSAMVDGEATAQQLAEVRPHVRNCAACRATVRELHRATAPLAVVLPALGMGVTSDPGHAGNPLAWVGRTAEGFAHVLVERSAVTTLKVQALVETASAGKLAAVAASAAVLTGGGVAAVERVVEPPRTTAAVVTTPASAGGAATTVQQVAALASPPAAPVPSPAPASAPAPAPAAARTPTTPAPAAAAEEEFSPAPVTTARTAGSRAARPHPPLPGSFERVAASPEAAAPSHQTGGGTDAATREFAP